MQGATVIIESGTNTRGTNNHVVVSPVRVCNEEKQIGQSCTASSFCAFSLYAEVFCLPVVN